MFTSSPTILTPFFYTGITCNLEKRIWEQVEMT